MNKIELRKEFSEYELYVFDLDGTLYYQKPFRIRMLTYLVTYIITHPLAVRDVFLIKYYRQIREKWDELENDSLSAAISNELSMDDRQYEYVAQKKHVSRERVRNAVEFFMMKAPLSLLPGYVDDSLQDIITELKSKGKSIVVYSDYPVEDKLNALGIKADSMYTSGDARIGVMKPDGKGLKVILGDFNMAPESVVMVGDRYEKDGLAAKDNEIDFVILSSKKAERADFYKNI